MDVLYYTLWSIVWILVAVPVVGLTSLMVWFTWSARQLRRRLAAAHCPHCGRPIGCGAAVAALRCPVGYDDEDGHCTRGIDPAGRRILCPACGRESFFYRYTEVITPTYTPLAGIPESTRLLPRDYN